MRTPRRAVLPGLAAVCAILAVSPLVAGRRPPRGVSGVGRPQGVAAQARPNVVFIVADDEFANAQPPHGVDGTAAALRGK